MSWGDENDNRSIDLKAKCLDFVAGSIFKDDKVFNDYFEFIDEESAGKWGREFRDSFSLSKSELNSLYAYAGSWYRVLNMRLLKGEYGSKESCELDADIDEIDAILRKTIIDRNIVVYRVTSKKLLDFAFEDNFYINKSFWSTSLLRKSAIRHSIKEGLFRYNRLVKIYIPAGKHVLYISDLGVENRTDWLREYEILIPRDTKFRIVKKHFLKRYIEIQMI
ncbi:MAG: hypothetical protein IJJ30_07655 [Erysipelotrichaceae bacterium]|nr:hypothetical protein [Erysipelotrichaceae bacterium]